MNPTDFIASLTSADPAVHAVAVKAAPLQSPEVLPALAELLGHQDFELSRRAHHAMEQLVRRATAPGSRARARAVENELLKSLEAAKSPQAKRQVIWLLSEIGRQPAVDALAALLKDPELREDARCVLMRIPVKGARAALEQAHKTAPPDFKEALAYSLKRT